jgi:uncharacterized protein YacL
MKKILWAITLLAAALPVLAIRPPEIDNPPFVNVDIWQMVNKALTWFLFFVILAAVVMIIMAGWEYVQAAGDSKKIQAALNRIIYAVVGIVVALLAKAIIMFACSFLGTGTCSFFQW